LAWKARFLAETERNGQREFLELACCEKQLEEGRCSVKVWEVCVGCIEFRTGSLAELRIRILLVRVVEKRNEGSSASGSVGCGM
jgi:hypothetical protein